MCICIFPINDTPMHNNSLKTALQSLFKTVLQSLPAAFLTYVYKCPAELRHRNHVYKCPAELRNRNHVRPDTLFKCLHIPLGIYAWNRPAREQHESVTGTYRINVCVLVVWCHCDNINHNIHGTHAYNKLANKNSLYQFDKSTMIKKDGQ